MKVGRVMNAVAFVRFWPARFAPARLLPSQSDSGQIVGLVAGRRVKLRLRDSVMKFAFVKFGLAEIRIGQRGADEKFAFVRFWPARFDAGKVVAVPD